MAIFFAIEFPVIVPYFKRGSRKTYTVQAIQICLFVLLAVAVSVLVWAAVDPFPLFGVMAKAAAILFLVLFCFYSVYAHRDHPMSKSSFQRYSMHIGAVFYFIMLPGLICFAASYHLLMQVETYRQVDMQIQASKIVFDGLVGVYKAQFQVQWGNKWACPKNPDVWCDTWMDEPDCSIITYNSTTTKEEFQIHAQWVQDCILEKYKLPAMGPLNKTNDNDDDWPEITALGTCSAQCQSLPMGTDIFAFGERVKLAGLILSCCGAILFFIYYCIIFGKDMLDVCNICCNKSKHLRALKKKLANIVLPNIVLPNIRQSDRIAPVSSPPGDVSINPLDYYSEDELEAIERNNNNNGAAAPSTITTPVMVEAEILDSDDDDYSSYGGEDEEYDRSMSEPDEDEEEERSYDEEQGRMEEEESQDNRICYAENVDDDDDLSLSSVDSREQEEVADSHFKKSTSGRAGGDELEIDV